MIGPMSAGDVRCPVDVPRPDPDGGYELPLASTPRSKVDLRRPIVDAVLCVEFNNEIDGTNRGVERRRVALADLAQFRTLAQQTTRGSKGAAQVACLQSLVLGAPSGHMFVLRIQGQRELELLKFGCGDVVRTDERSYSTPYLRDSFNRVLQGSRVIDPEGAS